MINIYKYQGEGGWYIRVDAPDHPEDEPPLIAGPFDAKTAERYFEEAREAIKEEFSWKSVNTTYGPDAKGPPS